MNDVSTVAYEALNLGKQNERDIEAHEDLCAERYAGIHEKIAEIKGFMKWGGGTAFSVILAILGFLAVAQFNANDRQQEQQRQQIDSLERELLIARSGREQ